GGKGIGQWIVRDVDRRLKLETALGEDPTNNLNQTLVLGISGIGGRRLGHLQCHLGTEPPTDHRNKKPQKPETELQVVGEMKCSQSAKDQTTHSKIADDGLGPGL